VTKIVGSGPWNCSDVQFFIGRVEFDDLGAARAKKLNVVPTSFKLSVETVDELITAGGDALAANATYQKFLGKR
jgi:NTE family protein